MTSISGTSSSSSTSPLQRLQATLQTDVTSGKVNSADQSALSSALSDIDASMKASGPPVAGTDPSSIQSKIQGLIDQEVSDGKLTADQATELKQVFTDAKPTGGPGDVASASGTGGTGHVHGHHHHKSSTDDTDSTSSTDSTTSLLDSLTGTSSTSTTTASTSPAQAAIQNLVNFLQGLTSATSSTTPYSSTGSTTSSSATSMLIDQLA